MIQINEDERSESIARGQTARMAHAEVAAIIATFEIAIVNELVSYYNAKKITNDMLLSGIAQIAAYRKLLNHLGREIKEGIEAQAERYS